MTRKLTGSLDLDWITCLPDITQLKREQSHGEASHPSEGVKGVEKSRSKRK
jgi:hypothetical protein